MKSSLRLKVTLVVSLTLAASIVLCWILNATLLGSFYEYSKRNTLDAAFSDVSALFDENYDEFELGDEIVIPLSRMEAAKNVQIYILKPEQTAYYYVYPLFSNPKDVHSKDIERINFALSTYLFGADTTLYQNNSLIYSSPDGFDMYKRFDELLEQNYMDLVGNLSNGYIVFIRTSVESILESTSIANTFLMYSGIVTIIISGILVMFLVKSFTNPINHLSAIATKVSNLDFEAKYEGKRKDEVGELGNSINLMSEKLERTISELKSANAELNRDIQSKIEAEKIRSEFISGVTHELKTPIAIIQGYAEGLMDNINEDAESRAMYCEVIIDEAQKMNKMVKMLLSLNQIESGANTIEYTRFNLTELVASLVDASLILIEKKNAKIYFERSAEVYAWADEYMIEEVVSNYLSNAINHVYENGIIEIKLIESGNNVRLAVFNTGDRIPEEDINKIWDKFYKVDKARTREYGGNGIGLSIVKAVMNAHNKPYGVINRETGVEFFIELETGTGIEA